MHGLKWPIVSTRTVLRLIFDAVAIFLIAHQNLLPQLSHLLHLFVRVCVCVFVCLRACVLQQQQG